MKGKAFCSVLRAVRCFKLIRFKTLLGSIESDPAPSESMPRGIGGYVKSLLMGGAKATVILAL